MSFVRVQLIARHDTLYELPFCEIDRCLHFTDTSTRVGGEAGGVVVGDNVLDDDDLHGGAQYPVFLRNSAESWGRTRIHPSVEAFFGNFRHGVRRIAN